MSRNSVSHQSPRTPKSVQFDDSPRPGTGQKSPKRDNFQKGWQRDDVSAMTMTPRQTLGTQNPRPSPRQGILVPNQNSWITIHKPPSMTPPSYQAKSTFVQSESEPQLQPSFWGACGSGARATVEDSVASNPYGLACGLIQEEADLLAKQKCEPKMEDFDEKPKLEQPVHAKWIQPPYNETSVQPVISPRSKATDEMMLLDAAGSEKQKHQIPKVLEDTTSVANNESPKHRILPMPPTPPSTPSKEDVRMMLGRVKQERKMKSLVKAAVADSLSSKSPSLKRSTKAKNKAKPDPEEIRSHTAAKEMDNIATSRSGMAKKETIVGRSTEMDALASANATKSLSHRTAAEPESSREMAKEQRPKQAMVLTRKTVVEGSFLGNLKCVPDSKDDVNVHTTNSSSLWDEARQQRYESLKGRAQHALPPTVKVSQSMQVETSSSSGSFVSSITGEVPRQKEPQDTESQSYTVPPFKASRSGLLFPVAETKLEEFQDQGHRVSQPFLPSSQQHTRAEFWGGSRDRIEESRDGCEVSPDSYRQPPAESSPTQEIGEILGIPSLKSAHSSKSALEAREDSVRSYEWEAKHKPEHRAQKKMSLNPVSPIQSTRNGLEMIQTTSRGRDDSQSRRRESLGISGKRSPGTPKLDQRTARLLYADQFADMVRAHSLHHVDKILSENKVEKVANAGAQTGLSFVVRKRPLMQDEVDCGDFDVVEAPSAHPDAVVLYEASILHDRKTKNLNAHLFRFDAVISEDQDFYHRIGQPYALQAKSGGFGTFILAGGHGSGKSHLISDIEQQAASELFTDLSRDISKVSLRCLEVNGSQCTDLLGPLGGSVRLVASAASQSTYEVKGALEASVSSNEMIGELLKAAQRRSITQNIVRHNEPHSYLIHQIFVESAQGERGCLTFVECPHEDQIHKSSQFSSLMQDLLSRALAGSSETHCTLSKVLSSAIQSKNSEICIVGAVSPVSAATESSLATLVSIKTIMKEVANGNRESQVQSGKSSKMQETAMMPRQWSQATLLEWMKKKNHLVLEAEQNITNVPSEQLTGQAVMRMTKKSLEEMFFKSMEDGGRRAEKLFIGLRAENDRASRQRVKQRRARERENSKTNQ
ncbi:MAG: hypothetical protein SGILL_005274 [Bacillariaceae sp.]